LNRNDTKFEDYIQEDYKMMKNYFKPNSKSFKVIELLNAGKTYDEVAKAMGYKNKNTISGIVSRWRKYSHLDEKTDLKTEDETSTSESDEKLTGETTELSKLEAFKKEILKSVNEIVRGTDQGGVAKEKIEVDEGSLVRRILYLTPKSLVFFDTAKAAGYPGDLSAYVNDTINKLYEKKGVALGLTQLRIL